MNTKAHSLNVWSQMSEHVQKVMTKHTIIGHLVNTYRAFGYRLFFGDGLVYPSSSGGAQETRKTRWNSIYHQNWWKHSFGSQIFCFVKFSFPVTQLMPYYAETGHSRPYSPDFTNNSNICHNKLYILYIVMDETRNFISHVCYEPQPII